MKYYDQALILLEFLLMKIVHEDKITQWVTEEYWLIYKVVDIWFGCEPICSRCYTWKIFCIYLCMERKAETGFSILHWRVYKLCYLF